MKLLNLSAAAAAIALVSGCASTQGPIGSSYVAEPTGNTRSLPVTLAFGKTEEVVARLFVANRDGKTAVCGARYADFEIPARTASNALGDIVLVIGDQDILRGFQYFARASMREELLTVPSICRVSNVAWNPAFATAHWKTRHEGSTIYSD